MKMHNLGYPDNRRNPRRWTDEEVADLLRLREVEKRTYRQIDEALARTPGSAAQKYKLIKDGLAPVGNHQVEGGRVVFSAEQDADRRARIDARNRMTPTATFFGDPPPGFSALDRRGKGELANG